MTQEMTASHWGWRRGWPLVTVPHDSPKLDVGSPEGGWMVPHTPSPGAAIPRHCESLSWDACLCSRPGSAPSQTHWPQSPEPCLPWKLGTAPGAHPLLMHRLYMGSMGSRLGPTFLLVYPHPVPLCCQHRTASDSARWSIFVQSS